MKRAPLALAMALATAAHGVDLKMPLQAGYDYLVTTGYGGVTIFRDQSGQVIIDRWHSGSSYYALDFDNPVETEDVAIVAAADGIVTEIFSDENTGYGYGVEILHNDGSKTIYGHFRNLPIVKKAQFVLQGQVLGMMGTSGNSTGTHLHFAFKDANGTSLKPEPLGPHTEIRPGKRYRSFNKTPVLLKTEDICSSQSCPISTWQFSTGELFGWYPAGDCLAAQKWFRLNRTEDDTLVPVSFTEAYYPCQCR